MQRYIFCTCLGTSGPWSEQGKGTSWEEFLRETLQQEVEGGMPCEDQDAEFCCAFPVRNGLSCLMKGKKACETPMFSQTPRVIIAIRAMYFPKDSEECLWSSYGLRSATKYWLAIHSPAV